MSAPVDWSTESGTISSDGRFVGVVPGPVRVTARAHDRPGLSDTAVIAVWQNETDPTGISIQPAEISLEEGDSLTFSAFLNLANGVQAAGATVDWSATGGQISSSGYYVAPSAGEYLVAAQTANGYFGTARVRVTKRSSEVASVVISPKTARLAPGQGTQFTANTYFSDGKTAPATYLWTATGGSVTQSGTYLAPVVEGTYKVIVVGVANIADTATVTVVQQAPTLASIRISPNPLTLQAGGAPAVLCGRNDDRRQRRPASGHLDLHRRQHLGERPATTLARFLARIGSSRRQQGGTIADTSVVTIQPPAVVALAVSPRSTSLQSGTSQQFTASATWSNGSTTLPPLNWSATGGTVTSNGRFTAGPSGTYQVTVAGGGLTDQATVNVGAPVVLVALSVSPNPAQLTTGGSQQFSVAALWSDGSSTLPAISWSATGGTISSNGLYSAGSATGSLSRHRERGRPGRYGCRDLDGSAEHPDAHRDQYLAEECVPQCKHHPAVQRDGHLGRWHRYDADHHLVRDRWCRQLERAVHGRDRSWDLSRNCERWRQGRHGFGDPDCFGWNFQSARPVSDAFDLPQDRQPGRGRGTVLHRHRALWADGKTDLPALSWTATDGTVSSFLTGGYFTPPSRAGTYRVMVSGGGVADTATVTVTGSAPAPTLNSLSISPEDRLGSERRRPAVQRHSQLVGWQQHASRDQLDGDWWSDLLDRQLCRREQRRHLPGRCERWREGRHLGGHGDRLGWDVQPEPESQHGGFSFDRSQDDRTLSG